MTPAPISVERLRYLAQEMLLVWNEDWIDELAEALPALLQQLAEREAEVERLRENAAGASETMDSLRRMLRHANEGRQAAERAREEAISVLRRIHAHGYTTTGDYDMVAAFLAANGGA